jgi:hypothetical protein
MIALDRFMKLFCGYENACGQHTLNLEPDETGKVKGRGDTKGYGASEKEYLAHLTGKGASLGLVPLMKNDTCWFGAIDIDIVGPHKLRETIEKLEKRIRKMELPLVVCRSKSGGVHLYLFGSEPLRAKEFVAKLREIAAIIGYGGTEVFPKQITRVNDEDRGNWINIAYYGVNGKDGTDRYCIKNGKPIGKLNEFCDYAELCRIDNKALQKVDVKLSDLFSDGPPCLQHLATFGFQQGGRNTSLYNIGVYCKKKHPDDWHDVVREMNEKLMQPPMDDQEVSTILRNLGRKDYFYTCNEPPICDHCNKKDCAKREFGIAQGKDIGELFPIENLTKCMSKDSVRWYAENNGHRIELTSEQLLSPTLLQRVFLDRFSIVIIIGKQRDWVIRLKELMETCDTVHDPDDASRQGQFENLVDKFFSDSRPAKNKDELIKGNSFAEGGRIHFRSEDLLNYLNIRRFTHTPHEVWMWLKQMSGESKQLRVKDKMLRVWTLPEPTRFNNATGIELPAEIEEEM